MHGCIGDEGEVSNELRVAFVLRKIASGLQGWWANDDDEPTTTTIYEDDERPKNFQRRNANDDDPKKPGKGLKLAEKGRSERAMHQIAFFARSELGI